MQSDIINNSHDEDSFMEELSSQGFIIVIRTVGFIKPGNNNIVASDKYSGKIPEVQTYVVYDFAVNAYISFKGEIDGTMCVLRSSEEAETLKTKAISNGHSQALIVIR